MPIERLSDRLASVWEYRLALVVAPPGSGKSTLMARFAEGVDAPVAWVRCDRWDATPATLCEQLAAALEPWTDGRSLGWTDIDAVIAGIGEWDPPRALLVIDDLHTLDGSAAEACVEQLLDHLPVGLRLLVASRTLPAFNLSRLRLAGDLLEIGADDLRLRAWEVERLFRDYYREPLAPEDLARLAHWTEGWAAGLQLFHLATRGRPADERRRVLGSLGPRSRLARQYLAQNALDRVPDELRTFMIQTSVSGRLSGRICDRLLDRTGSEDVLDELERRCLFTTQVGESGDYRYHEVFRSHLQGVLIGEVGDEGARARFLAAGDVLMEEGTAAEALEAYVHAEAWEVVEQVLEDQGPAIAEEPLRWLGIHSLEPLGHDPWLALAGARRLRAEGRFGDAAKAYAALAADARHAGAADIARRERSELLTWLHPEPGRRLGPEVSCWTILHEAVSGSSANLGDLAKSDTEGRFVTALCAALQGDLPSADRQLARLEEDAEAEGLVTCLAAMARGAICLIGGDDDGVTAINGAVGAAEGQGLEWVARVGRSLLALSGRADHLYESARLEDNARAIGDRWGAALMCTARAWGALLAANHSELLDERLQPVALADSARLRLRALDAPVLEAWAAAIAALARSSAGAPEAIAFARRSESTARAARTLVPGLLARTALAVARGDHSETARLVEQELAGYGWRLPTGPDVLVPRSAPSIAPSAAPPSAMGRVEAPTPPARLRLFGGCHLEIGGEVIDVNAIRPRVRTLLYVLALDVGRTVHRETLMEVLWPGADPGAASRSLHVAVATLRRVLEPSASRGGFRLLPRDGVGYRLALPPGSHIDTVGFAEAVSAARTAEMQGDGPEVQRWCRMALERNRGELLPEAGPDEWVDARRQELRAEAVEVATMLARTLLRGGDADAAATVCLEGLHRDRYHDPLWKLLIAARDACGDRAAASSARSSYERTLAELGLAADGSA